MNNLSSNFDLSICIYSITVLDLQNNNNKTMKRKVMMTFRVSEAEQQIILNIAQSKGLSASEFLRELLSGYAGESSEEIARNPDEPEREK